MLFSFIGLIKKNSQLSKVLVKSQEEKYYVWTSEHKNINMFCTAGGVGEIPVNELELANQRQIDIGRGNLWVPNSSNTVTQVEYIGVISGGKKNKSVLVHNNNCYSVCTVASDLVAGLSTGDMLAVDRRFLFTAREDHIKAGLGEGKLQRRKRVSVS